MVNNRIAIKPLFIFLMLCSFLALASGQQIHWSNETLISSSNNSTQRTMYPAIAPDSQRNMHIIWMQQFGVVGEVFYSKIDKLGNIIINNRQISNFSGVQGFRSDIAVDKWDNIHIIYDYDKTGTILHGAMYIRLDSNGNIIVNGTLLPRNTLGSELAVDSQGNIHLANGWIYQKFDNFGNALIPEIPLGNASQWEPREPGIVLDSNDNAHITWMEENITRSPNPAMRIKYSKIDSNGSIVINGLQLDSGFNYFESPSIAVDKQDNVYLSWYSRNESIESNYLSKIDKNGAFTIDRKQFPSRNIGSGAIDVDPLGNINFIGGGHGYLQLNSTGDLIIGPIIMAIEIGSSVPKITIDRQGAMHLVWHVANHEIREYKINYRKSLNPATISMRGIPRQGSTIEFDLQDIYNLNGSYYFGLSTGSSPGMSLGDGRIIPLNDDDLLKVSLNNPKNIGLVNSIGRLNSFNQATVSFTIPTVPPLNGTTLYGSFITVDSSSRIVSISDAIEFTIV